MTVIGADVLELPNDSDWELDDFIPLPHFGQHATLSEITERLTLGVNYSLGGSNAGLDAIVVASGGWQLDPVTVAEQKGDFDMQEMARAYGESMETMMRMNFYPVAAAGFIAQEFMAPEGMLNEYYYWCLLLFECPSQHQ